MKPLSMQCCRLTHRCLSFSSLVLHCICPLIPVHTPPLKTENLYLTKHWAHLYSHSVHRLFGLRDLAAWATKNTGGHNNVPCAWEQSCTFSRASVHWCERLSFSGKLRGCTGVIQRLGGELKFGGCYKRMLMLSSASSLSDGDCSCLYVWTHTAVYCNGFCRPRVK